jgi:hypothetical protein
MPQQKSRLTREKPQEIAEEAVQNGTGTYEQELAGYLQERIKPGLNRGAIPLLARSIAKELAHWEHPNGGSQKEEEEPEAEADEELEDESQEEPEAESEAESESESDEESDDQSDFEADMREFQEELGEDWILRFSVQGEDAWLTAEKEDGSQRVEAPTASVLAKVVKQLNEHGGRSS